MKHANHKILAALAAASLGLGSQAHADLRARLLPMPSYQVGTEGVITLGTIVTASTNLNALWASANYRVECDAPQIRPALTGSRGWSDNGFTGPRSILITVPEWQPAQQALPGWQTVMGGTYVSCVNTHFGAAKTHILPIGGGGSSFPIGGDYWEESIPVTFGLIKPGTSFGGGCIM